MPDIKYKFSGHQTFVLRYGWLEKGVRLIQQDPHGFLEDNILIQLGVGKNMVDSIRYWCNNVNLLDEVGGGNLQLTSLAKFIFGDNDNIGVDPFLEDDATLWLLHWSLMQNQVISTWQLAFFKWHKPEFTKGGLQQSIKSWILNQHKVTDATLSRDIDCFVRCYAGTKSKDKEECFDSPFLCLGLLQSTSQPDLYRFNIGGKNNLPAEIVGYALLKFMKRNQNTLLVQNCLYEEGSPGQVFKLNEGALMDYLLELEKITSRKIMVSDTSGMVSVIYNGKGKNASKYAEQLLHDYYGVPEEK